VPQVTPLKIAIVSSGKTIVQLAQETGFGETDISRWANGRHVPIKRTRIALAEALGKSVEDLFPEPVEDAA
jgi:transcriptional regulator with XRE-family HTH domain